MGIVEEYWQGVLQRLQAEVDVFARLVHHAGEQGKENELALARLLTSLLPTRYGVGTGQLIDKAGNYSSQTDVIVYEQADEPAILAQTTQLLFPVENVAACIEVKTTLRYDDLNEFAVKRGKLAALEPCRSRNDSRPHPLFALLAYSMATTPSTLKTKLSDAPLSDLPDLLCVLRPGLIGSSMSSPASEPSYEVGLVLLPPLEGESSADGYVVHQGAGEYTRAGRIYPKVMSDKTIFVGDPARALLLFIDALLRELARFRGVDPPILSEYLTTETRRRLPL
jgi:hypothetical protein